MKRIQQGLFTILIVVSSVYAQQTTWSLLLYMEAPDLHDAVLKNITELLEARTSETANIFVQIHVPGSIAWRYRVCQGALIFEEAVTLSLDYQKDITSACRWAYGAYPSRYHALMLWGHGCGILLPTWNEQEREWRVEHDAALDICTECFRSLSCKHKVERHRAILLNDHRHDYLGNNAMVHVMKIVSEDILHKKIDILGFDCCLGAMIEHAYQVSPYVDYLIGCQNCELPDGFDYYGLGKRISDSSCTPRDLVSGVVEDYGIYYQKYAQKGLYTLAGFDCSKSEKIKQLLDSFVMHLIPELTVARKNALKELMVERCIRFCWMPMYTDLYTFLHVIEQSFERDMWSDMAQEAYHALKSLLAMLKLEIEHAVVHNVTGYRMADAHGISVYVPYSHIDSSYYATPFAKESKWIQFLKVLIQTD